MGWCTESALSDDFYLVSFGFSLPSSLLSNVGPPAKRTIGLRSGGGSQSEFPSAETYRVLSREFFKAFR